jgi:YbgC/YbaW family acyl-CoA thioester hydrolase
MMLAPTGPAELARARLRVPLRDVDAAGLIYFGAPFPWSEAILSEWMAQEVRPLGSLFADGVALPVVATRAEFHSPLRQDEIVDLVLSTTRLGRTSLTLRTEACRPDGEVAIVVESVHVFVTGLDADLRPTPLPAWLRRPLERGLAPETVS